MTMVISRCCFLCEQEDVRPTEPYTEPRYKKGKRPAFRCIDRKACAAEIRENERLSREDACLVVAESAADLVYARDRVKAVERELAAAIQFALKEGASVTVIARAARLSRERIYQIRDGRR